MIALDIVSPLPPVRSGIADYGADLLPHLAALADLRLIPLENQPLEAAIAERYPTAPPAETGAGGRLPLYQMGNNPHHEGVYALAMELPGVLVLHDLVLHHFLIGRTLEGGDFEAYRAALVYDHGWIGDAAARALRWPGASGDSIQFALPAHRGLLSRQRGIIVHSRWAADELATELPGLAVEAVPMAMPLGREADRAEGRVFRRRHGIPEGVPLVGAFGFQTPIKRTASAIEALAAPELDGLHLMVAGEVSPSYELERRAREAGVAERVHFLGFLPFDEFEAAIAAADLCLNLRYPTAGETSASLLRVLAVGRPALVSEHGPSAELATEAAIPVPVGEGEREALVARLAELLAAPERLAELGRAARRHVTERHDPARSAGALVEVCGRFAEREPLGWGPARPPAPTSLAWSRMPAKLEVSGAETPWAEGERRWIAIRLENPGPARWLAGERPAGGVAVEVELFAGGRDLRADEGWIGLPFDLEPGEAHVFELDLRRPLGPARLVVRPHVLDFTAFDELGGPSWAREI